MTDICATDLRFIRLISSKRDRNIQYEIVLESLVSDATRRSYKRGLAKFEEYYGKSSKFLLNAHALFCPRLSFHFPNLPIWRTEGVCSVLEV